MCKTTTDRLLTAKEAAELLNTKPRFIYRLTSERRIRFTRIGGHVRIPESAAYELIKAGMVEPVTRSRSRSLRRAA